MESRNQTSLTQAALMTEHRSEFAFAPINESCALQTWLAEQLTDLEQRLADFITARSLNQSLSQGR
ncbi:MAG TPA: hypothetical protein PKD64_04190 [Pirellulaceae bacterium]|nr:hypothetical protein [Pirellulaceae bacterium]HMO91372.1 hypothetical protein [Pirellulaceae bacterium]HMP70236.1 hypothetical protein [Pirellulaceae bacterium]